MNGIALGFAIAAMFLLAAPAGAVEEHHPAQPGRTAQAPQAASPAPAQQLPTPGMGMMGPGAMGPGMMNPGMMGPGMMGQGMMGQGMMGGMGHGGMQGADSVGPLDRVEGRIAFLRAELKIGEPQNQAWSGFAEALRVNAKKLAELPRAPLASAGAATTLNQRLEHQEHVLALRLDAVKALRAALQRLYGVLSDEQKKTADELLPMHGGMTRLGVI
jgi:LTXXQ motif family protein